MKQRNMKATCGTCPYWQDKEGTYYGLCKRYASEWQVASSDWCGQHPNFFADTDGAEGENTQAIVTRYSQAYTESLEREQAFRADIAARDAVIAGLCEAAEQMIEMGHADNAKDDGVTMKSTVARMLAMKKMQSALDAAKEITS